MVTAKNVDMTVMIMMCIVYSSLRSLHQGMTNHVLL